MINTDELKEILDRIPYGKSAESFENVILYQKKWTKNPIKLSQENGLSVDKNK